MRLLVASLSLALVASTASAARIQVRNFHETSGTAAESPAPHLRAGGPYVPGRPRIIDTRPSARRQAMTATILTGNTPSIAVFGGKHTTMTLPTDDLSHRPAYTVSVTPGKKARFVALIPASGHVGGADVAETYAATNVYFVRLDRPDGSTQTAEVPSTGFVTRAKLKLELGQGDNVLTIFPKQSGGPSGFPGGRELILRRE